MNDFVYGLLVIGFAIIVILLIDRRYLVNGAESMRHDRNHWRSKHWEDRVTASRLKRELQAALEKLAQQKSESDRIAAEKRAAGIALGFIEPLEEVDEIPF